ncbi:MAG TPA: 3-dehydroquinate synthase, partial [Bacteroidota bacterium]|nr:3-dehydroquinate synthase [Bacteroidota bacterium]
METLRVRLPEIPPSSYPVHFCAGPGAIASRIVAISRGAQLFLVTDRSVYRHHGMVMQRMLLRSGVTFRAIVLPGGERTKNRRSKESLEDLLIRSGAERSSVVAAFGGGVIGDLVGFTAATLFRGVRLIHIPTTLLSQVDSAVGGKVGIDHPMGKNLLGAFHHPEAVLIDPGFLRTLPEREYLQGMAEVIKYGLILDRRLFLRLKSSVRAIRSRNRTTLLPVIARCCALKGRVVAADERESGYRRILNFGHTVGHALEQASHYVIPHGMAVSIGMAAEAGISLGLGMITPADLADLLGLLGAYGLPVSVPRGIPRAAILRALSFDKKKSGGVVRFTLPRGIGRGVTGVEVPPEILSGVLGR